MLSALRAAHEELGPAPRLMRLGADENFPLPTIEALRQDGHDVAWVRTDYLGAKDATLLELAESHPLVLLTLDKDFWQIAMQHRVHPAVPGTITPHVVRTLAMDQQCTGMPPWSQRIGC